MIGQGTVTIMVGDAITRLRELPEDSVHCVITSPPYWGLRAYHLCQWEGGDPNCEHQAKLFKSRKLTDDMQSGSLGSRERTQGPCLKCGAVKTNISGGMGLEPTFEEHLKNLVEVFREVRRVLRKDGTVWLNYGDAYASGGGPSPQGISGQMASRSVSKHRGHNRPATGNKPKDLMMMPARVAMALQADGWWLRSEIIWHKPNSMPESVKDRPKSAHEKVFLLSKSAKYFYDAEAVRVPSICPNDMRHPKGSEGLWEIDGRPKEKRAKNIKLRDPDSVGRSNLRNVWEIATHSFSEAHFATFPPKLVEPCIKAGTSEKGVCVECGTPWVRQTEVSYGPTRFGHGSGSVNGVRDGGGDRKEFDTKPRLQKNTKTTGWSPTCKHEAESVPAVCIDPFSGAGTVGLVAQRLGRSSILIEISPEYAEMSRARITKGLGMFSKVSVA